ncbi:MAG: LysR family transcriptional regulator [Sneathiella sp.]|nr:LysR family transcriptional regulator [Sneathiella sp.]
MKNIDWNLVKVFCAIYEHGKVSTAANAIHLSQPAVSNALNRLRHATNDELFVRSRGGVHPTARAIILYRHFKRAFTEVEQGLDLFDGFDPITSQRTFRVTLSNYGEINILPELSRQMIQNYRGINIEKEVFLRENVMDQLLNQQLDLVVGTELDLIGDIQCKSISEEPFVVVMSNNHSIKEDSLTMKQLINLDHVSIDRSNRSLLNPYLKIKDLGHHIPIRLSVSFWSVLHLVSTSEMVSIVPVKIAKNLQNAFNFRILPLPFPCSKLKVNLYWHAKQETEPGNLWLRTKITHILENG